MAAQTRSAALSALIDPAAELTCLGTGYEFTEGPIWAPREQCLYFSDIPGDTRWRWSEERGMEVAARPTFKGNGMALDGEGNLIVCEHVTSSVTRIRSEGRSELLAFHYRGSYLNSPNDVVVRRVDGSIYFTDPDYGRWNDWVGQERSRDQLGFKGLFRVPPGGGELELLAAEDEFDQPNGLCFSPDESLLYVNDSPRAHIKVFDVQRDGSLANGRLFLEHIGAGFPNKEDGEEDEAARHQELHDAGAVDGMECDEHGNVWVTGPRGVWVISPEGEQLGVVPAPEVVGSLTWGGQDMHTLFLMTSTSVHAVRTHVTSAPLPGQDR
jgi:gluconolactonase